MRRLAIIGLCFFGFTGSMLPGTPAFAVQNETIVNPKDLGLWGWLVYNSPQLSSHFSFNFYQLAALNRVLMQGAENNAVSFNAIKDLPPQDQIAKMGDMLQPVVQRSLGDSTMPADFETVEDLHEVLKAVPESLRQSVIKGHQQVQTILNTVPVLQRIPKTLSLQLPSGTHLLVRVLSSEKEKMLGLMDFKELPHEGAFFPLQRQIVHKDVQMPVDYVLVSYSGYIRRVIPNIPPSPPETPWTKTLLIPAHRQHVLVLPAGQAEREGLKINQQILGADIDVPAHTVKTLANNVLYAGWLGRKSVLTYFEDNPNEYLLFEDVLNRINKRISFARPELFPAMALAKSRFFADAMESREITRRSHFYGMLMRADLKFWLKQAPPIWRWVRLGFGLSSFPTIFAHESGHYLAARLLGARVLRFRVFLNRSGFVDTNNFNSWKDAAISITGPLVHWIFESALLASIIDLLKISFHLSALSPVFSIGPVHFSLPAILIAACSAFLAGKTDWINAAYSLGWERFAYEMRWRLKKSGKSYLRHLFDLYREARKAR